MRTEAPDQPASRGVILVSRAFVAAGIPIVFAYAMVRWVNVDEIEALHTAWLTGAGGRIFIDFFQHHNPLLYPLLAPVPHAFGAAEAVLVGRIAIFVLLLAILGGTALLARELFDRPTAEITAPLLLATPFFVARAIEVRPDVPQALFAILGLWALFRGLRLRSATTLAASGAAFGVSFAFLQKTGVLLIPVLVVLAVREWRRPDGLARVAAFGLAAAVPPLLVLAWMALAGSLHEYLLWNFLLVPEVYGDPALEREVLVESVRLVATTSAIAILGLGLGVVRGLGTRPRREALAVLGVAAGFFVATGRYWGQYYLPLVPVALVFAAAGLHRALGGRTREIAVTLGLASLLAWGHYAIDARSFSNREQLEQIAFVTLIADPGERVHDPAPLFNIARPGLDFFWFEIDADDWLGVWQRRTGYVYDLGALVARHRPPVINRVWAGRDSLAPEIVDWYDPVPEFPNLLIRRPVPRERAAPR